MLTDSIDYSIYFDVHESTYDIIFRNEDVIVSQLQDKSVAESLTCLLNNNLIDINPEGEMVVMLPLEGYEVTNDADFAYEKPTLCKLTQEVFDEVSDQTL